MTMQVRVGELVSGNGHDLDLPMPSGVNADELLVSTYCQDASNVAIPLTTDAAFQLIEQNSHATQQFAFATWAKPALEVEQLTYTVEREDSSNDPQHGSIVAFYDDGGASINASKIDSNLVYIDNGTNTINSGNVAIPSNTRALLVLDAFNDGNRSVNTAPADWSFIHFSNANGIALARYYREVVTGGSAEVFSADIVWSGNDQMGAIISAFQIETAGLTITNADDLVDDELVTIMGNFPNPIVSATVDTVAMAIQSQSASDIVLSNSFANTPITWPEYGSVDLQLDDGTDTRSRVITHTTETTWQSVELVSVSTDITKSIPANVTASVTIGSHVLWQSVSNEDPTVLFDIADNGELTIVGSSASNTYTGFYRLWDPSDKGLSGIGTITVTDAGVEVSEFGQPNKLITGLVTSLVTKLVSDIPNE